MDAIQVAAGIAGVLALLYVALIGQRTLIEWWRERKNRKAEAATNPAATPPMHNLPALSTARLVNRKDELERLLHQLGDAGPGESMVVGITGFGGIGKTTLALHIGHHFLAEGLRQPPGRFTAIVWCSAQQYVLTGRGMITRSPRVQTLNDIERALAITLQRRDIMHAPVEDRYELIRSLLARERVLMIIDNIEAMDDNSFLVFLRDLPPPTAALVTTRPSLGLPREIAIGAMLPEYARELVEQELRAKGAEYSEHVVDELTKTTGGIPLAAVWSAAQLTYGYELETVVRRLSMTSEDIVQYSFETTISRIRDTESHRLLMALSLFATNADRKALGWVAGTSSEDARDDAIATLLQLSLVLIEDSRLSMLPLTKQFVSNELLQYPEFTNAARTRLFDYLQELVSQLLGDDYWQPITHWIQQGSLEVEIENLLQAVRWASEESNWRMVLQLGGPLVHHLWRLGRAEERKQVSEWGVEAARRLDEHAWESWLLIDGLGYIYLSRQEFDEADRIISMGQRVAAERDLPDQEALAMAYRTQMAALQDGVNGRQILRDAAEKASMTAVLARVKAVEGHLALYDESWTEAMNAYREAIELRRISDGYDPPTQVALLGLVMAQAGDYAEARSILQSALDHRRQTTEGSGYANYGMAVLALADGRLSEADERATEALSFLRRVGVQLVVSQLETFLEDVRRRRRRRWPFH
jgi:LuxR family glucitol operon transcriptional activator